MEVLNSPPEKRWKNSVTEVKARRSFTVIHTAFWQKGACEKNHEYIRYICPKGSSFANLNDDKVRLMMNHINNEKRDSFNGHSPYELSLLLLDNKLHKSLGLKAIEPDDVMLSPKLIK